VRELLATYAENEDLVTIGAYRKGANRTLDAAVDMRDEINRHLRQTVEERVTIEQVRKDLAALAGKCLTRLSSAGPTVAAAPPLPPPGGAAKRPTVIKAT
jgi:flagellum-specific ATP synthase